MGKKLRRPIPGRFLEHNNLITAVGALIYCPQTNRALFLLRDQDTYSGSWGLVGGRSLENETVLQTLHRECREETGYRIVFDRVMPVELYQSSDNHFNYHTFLCIVDAEFIPILSTEHNGYCWAPVNNAPKPLHPGLYNCLNTDLVKQKLNLVETSLRV